MIVSRPSELDFDPTNWILKHRIPGLNRNLTSCWHSCNQLYYYK